MRLFYHDSPITRSHFMDPTDRAIKGFYCTDLNEQRVTSIPSSEPVMMIGNSGWKATAEMF